MHYNLSINLMAMVEDGSPASPKQIAFLAKRDVDGQGMTKFQASAKIDALLGNTTAPNQAFGILKKPSIYTPTNTQNQSKPATCRDTSIVGQCMTKEAVKMLINTEGWDSLGTEAVDKALSENVQSLVATYKLAVDELER